VFEAGAKTPEDVSALAGRRGRLVVTRASYRGIERVDNLLVTAVLDGENDPLPTPAVGVLLASPVREVGPSLDLPEGQALHDAIDTALLIDQAAVSDQDQARFDQMLRQLDYYLADQVQIIRRKEAGLNVQIEELEKRLRSAHGVQAGDAINAQLKSLLKERGRVEQQIADLQEGGDAEYRQWRERLVTRRYSRPDITRVLDVRFEIAGTPC